MSKQHPVGATPKKCLRNRWYPSGGMIRYPKCLKQTRSADPLNKVQTSQSTRTLPTQISFFVRGCMPNASLFIAFGLHTTYQRSSSKANKEERSPTFLCCKIDVLCMLRCGKDNSDSLRLLPLKIVYLARSTNT